MNSDQSESTTDNSDSESDFLSIEDNDYDENEQENNTDNENRPDELEDDLDQEQELEPESEPESPILDDNVTSRPKPNKKNSDVWNHFDVIEERSKCKYCTKSYSKNTSTSILWRHYYKEHDKKSGSKTKQSLLQFPIITPHPDNIMHEKTESLIEWIVLDLQPFSVVESESFIKMVNKLDPHYRLSSRHTIKRSIIQKFDQNRNLILEHLQNVTSKISLTCDIWSSIKMESFIAITVHYIDSKWKLCHFVLDIFSFAGSHTGLSISEKILQLLSEMQLENKIIAITTDNGSNMVAGCRRLVDHFNLNNTITGLTHYRCAAHILNLAVKEGLSDLQLSVKKLRRLIKKIRKSALLIDDLKHIFQSDNQNFLFPQLDIKTRWNSTFNMIDRAIKIKLQLETLKLRHSSLNLYWLTNKEWEEIQDVGELLSEFAMATTELSGQNYPTIAHVCVIFLSLIAYLSSRENDSEYLLHDMVIKIKQKLEEYWNLIGDNLKVLAFFDPRYKNLCFIGMDTNSVLSFIRQKLPSITQTQEQTQTQTNQSCMSHFLSRLSSEQSIIPVQKDEISSYWNLASASCDISPLDWWKAHETEYPLLSKLAKDFLSIMATSVPCEQLFSIAGLTITKSRNRLTGKSARAILCLKSWLEQKII